MHAHDIYIYHSMHAHDISMHAHDITPQDMKHGMPLQVILCLQVILSQSIAGYPEPIHALAATTELLYAVPCHTLDKISHKECFIPSFHHALAMILQHAYIACASPILQAGASSRVFEFDVLSGMVIHTW